MTISLRPFQQTGVAEIRTAFIAGHRAVLYVLPTGGGKTYTFCYITHAAAAKGNRVCILVHRKELLSQASLSLASLGVQHGIIAPNNRVRDITHDHQQELGRSLVNQGAGVQVASIQTFGRPGRLTRWAHQFELMIPDEAHHATAGQWHTALDAAYNARILGCTATPTRTDGQGLGRHCGGVFDHMVLGPSINDLINEGYLVKPILVRPPNDLDMSGVRKSRGDFNRKQMTERVGRSTIVGDAVYHYKKYINGLPALAFTASVEEAGKTAEEFRAAGVTAVAISGETPDAERRGALKGLETGRVQLVASCDIISEGTDVPVVAGCHLLRPTDSEILYIQQGGRTLRPAPGKDCSYIFDHVGNSFTHGYLDEDRAWTLDGKEKRTRDSDSEGSLSVRQCPHCYCAHRPAPVCPLCGHEYPINQREIDRVAGELEVVSEQQKHEEMQKRAKQRERRRRMAQARTLEDFLALADEWNYKPGWAHKMMEVRKAQGRAA